MSENKNVEIDIEVKMFSEFQVKKGDSILNDDNTRSVMVTKLLTFFLNNRNRMIPIQELGELLWTEDESDNQVGALKNLMYRLRSIMKKILGDTEFILTGRGTYYWNPEISVKTDCEEFEELYKKAKELDDNLIEQTACYQRAFSLYTGGFLPKLSSEHWVISLSAYYHSMFLTLSKTLAELYEKQNLFEEMENVCNQALLRDSLDEYLYFLLIKAMIGQHKVKLAEKCYTQAVKHLYENLGVKPSKQLQEVYNSLLSQMNEQELDLRTIQDDLKEAAKPRGVFLCEYGIFREIYRIQARQAKRFGMAIHVGLITISVPSYVKEGSEVCLSMLKQAMEHTEKTFLTLRSGDIAARYSGSQYVMLLPTCTYESGKSVMIRIEQLFFGEAKWKNYSLQWSLEEIFAGEMDMEED